MSDHLTKDAMYALILEHLGLKKHRDETVIDSRTGRYTDAARYFDLMDAAIAAYLRKHGEPGDVPSYCPKCGSEEWDEVFERGYPPPIARRCARCDTEWSTK